MTHFSQKLMLSDTVKDARFPVNGQRTSNPGQIQNPVKSRTGPRKKVFSWKI